MKKSKKIFIVCIVTLLIFVILFSISVFLIMPKIESTDDSILKVDGMKYYKCDDCIWKVKDISRHSKFIGFLDSIRWGIYKSDNKYYDNIIIVQYNNLLQDVGFLPILYFKEGFEPKSFELDNIDGLELRFANQNNQLMIRKIIDNELKSELFDAIQNGAEIDKVGPVEFVCYVDFINCEDDNLYFATGLYKKDNEYILLTDNTNKKIILSKELGDAISNIIQGE